MNILTTIDPKRDEEGTTRLLAVMGHAVTAVPREKALARLREAPFDLLLLRLALEDCQGG